MVFILLNFVCLVVFRSQGEAAGRRGVSAAYQAPCHWRRVCSRLRSLQKRPHVLTSRRPPNYKQICASRRFSFFSAALCTCARPIVAYLCITISRKKEGYYIKLNVAHMFYFSCDFILCQTTLALLLYNIIRGMSSLD
jgi:hypothetical protein